MTYTPTELATWIANQPKSDEFLLSTWNPPEWEDIVSKWDLAVIEARKLTGIVRSPATVQS